MGFLDNLGEYAGEKFNQAVRDYKSTSQQGQRMDNKKLFEKFNSETNFARKMGYGMELKRRQMEMEENRNNDNY